MNDEDLILQIRRGNTTAFRHLVDKYSNMVWFLVLRMVRQREDAEDISQEVFYKVYHDINKFRGDSKLSTWIGSVAFHTTTDYLRKRGRAKIIFTDDETMPQVAAVDFDTPYQMLKKEDVKGLIHRIIDNLPLQYRTVITLYHLEQFSYAEISEITGMPEGTVKSNISRGRSAIKQKLLSLVPELEHDYSNND